MLAIERTVVGQQRARLRSLSGIALADRACEGEDGPCPIAAESVPRRVETEGGALLMQPINNLGNFIERSGKAVVRGQPIIDARHGAARSSCIFAHEPVVRVDAEQHPARTVDLDQHRQIGRVRRDGEGGRGPRPVQPRNRGSTPSVARLARMEREKRIHELIRTRSAALG